jgi:hypothetical protein
MVPFERVHERNKKCKTWFDNSGLPISVSHRFTKAEFNALFTLVNKTKRLEKTHQQ